MSALFILVQSLCILLLIVQNTQLRSRNTILEIEREQSHTEDAAPPAPVNDGLEGWTAQLKGKGRGAKPTYQEFRCTNEADAVRKILDGGYIPSDIMSLERQG